MIKRLFHTVLFAAVVAVVSMPSAWAQDLSIDEAVNIEGVIAEVDTGKREIHLRDGRVFPVANSVSVKMGGTTYRGYKGLRELASGARIALRIESEAMMKGKDPIRTVSVIPQ